MSSTSQNDLLKLLPLLRPHFKKLILGGICILIYVTCWPILAWLAGKLIPAIGEGDLTKVTITISFALIIFLIQKLAQLGQDTLMAEPALYVSQDLRQILFRKLQRIKLDSLEKLSSGDLTYRLTEDADRIGEIIYKTIQDTTPSALQLLVVFGYMFYLDINLTIATLLLAPLVVLLVSKFGEKVMVAAEKSQRQVSELASLLGEGILGIPLIRAFAAESWMERRFEKEVILHRKARFKTLKLLALQHPVVGFIEATGILSILAIGAFRIKSGDLDSSGFSSYIAALLMIIDPISHLTTNYNELKQAQASFKRLKGIEKEQMEKEDNTDAKRLIKPKGKIRITNLCFAYDINKPVLNKVNIDFIPDKITALVGPSGAGKSTIFSLLLKFITPSGGSIEIDNTNINDVRVKDLRKSVALVPQRTMVFSGSIKEAILLGRESTNEALINSAKLANAHEFIINLKNGYNTKLEERGTNLSGGQIQRIAIARAVLGNPAVLLLDEATSALDAESESEVQLGLKQAMKGRTVVIIAHRLATVQEADMIYVLDKGRICDYGNHYELIKRFGKYRELCEKQLIKQSE